MCNLYIMRTINNWLDEYGDSHQNDTNELIHWICVPLIFFAVTGLLYGIKLPFFFQGHQLNIAMIAVGLVLIYYFMLSPTLSAGMFLFSTLCLFVAHCIERSGIMPLWLFCVIIFVLAWIGQFYGHKIEGKKPSFLKDLQFLMIGPAWLMSFLYKRMGIKL